MNKIILDDEITERPYKISIENGVIAITDDKGEKAVLGNDKANVNQAYLVGDIKTSGLKPDEFYKIHSPSEWIYMDGKTTIPKASAFYALTGKDIAPDARNMFFRYNSRDFNNQEEQATSAPTNPKKNDKISAVASRDILFKHPSYLKNAALYHIFKLSKPSPSSLKGPELKTEGHFESIDACGVGKECYLLSKEDIPLPHRHDFEMNGSAIFDRFDSETRPKNVAVFAYLKIN